MFTFVFTPEETMLIAETFLKRFEYLRLKEKILHQEEKEILEISLNQKLAKKMIKQSEIK